ncbi:MAG: superoxide dismutase, Ni [Candidatus Heimdallarchaeota archaeon]|nr:superoxide dismutase, Ni [Candidatus Heimdallarchaeota archaeon]
MMKNVIKKIFNVEEAFAHCDAPCGIYHPHAAIEAADTVISMVTKLLALEKGDDKMAYLNTFTRFVATKEEYAEKCKKEVLILWTDKFTAEGCAKAGIDVNELHETVWATTKLCSDNKRNINLDMANKLKESVLKVADLFNKL